MIGKGMEDGRVRNRREERKKGEIDQRGRGEEYSIR